MGEPQAAPTAEPAVQTVFHGDSLDVLKTWEDNSVDSVVCDPPYELSNDGKASASRVFVEFMFPEDAKIEAEVTSEFSLALLVHKVLELHIGRVEPGPSCAVKKSPVTLDDNSSRRNDNVEHTSKTAAIVSDSNARQDVEAEPSEHLGTFALKLTDETTLLDALGHAGCAFASSGLGVGFRISSTSLPDLLRDSFVVDNSDPNVRAIDNALPLFVSTLAGAEVDSVASFQLLARASEDSFTTTAALKILAVLKRGRAQLVRADARARRLSSKLETRRISVVSPSTNRTLTLDLICHPQNLATKGFMGKAWDGSKIGYDVSFWREVLRVLKPGGHLLAFGATRTYHRVASAIEDAGFEIRDCIFCWVYASGFPKSLDISKAIDKSAGHWRGRAGEPLEDGPGRAFGVHYARNGKGDPVTAAAAAAAGWGTALKPSCEPIIVARKPLDGTVAENFAKWGTGGINIDACRIGDEPRFNPPASDKATLFMPKNVTADTGRACVGRWPANSIFDEDSADEVISRYFYVAKPSSRERDAGLEDHAPVAQGGIGALRDGGRHEYKSSAELGNRKPDSPGPGVCQAGAVAAKSGDITYTLRSDLTPEQVEQIYAELASLGVKVDG